MLRTIRLTALFIALCSMGFSSGYAQANTLVANFDAMHETSPTSQGWSDFLSGQATGTVVQDLNAASWKSTGSSGRAQWNMLPTT
ncbi:hypothetical protein ACVBKF_06535, partial [Shewanella sp. 0m-11]